MANLLQDSISKYVSLTPKETEAVVAVAKPKAIKRKQFLVKEGAIHKNAVFVIEGCLRSYSLDKNGFEHILQFAPPGWWISDMHSFKTRQPGTLFIDAVDDSEILEISKQDMDTLYLTVPKLERYFRLIAENALANYQHRLIDNLALSAMERYENFCKLYPSLIACLPQKQVAAYIGVTPEFLSKMLHQPLLKK